MSQRSNLKGNFIYIILTNKNENITCHNLWVAAKALLRRKSIAVKTLERRKISNNLILHLNELIIKGMQIKAILRYQFLLIRMANVKKKK